jgi:hypothetical protein
MKLKKRLLARRGFTGKVEVGPWEEEIENQNENNGEAQEQDEDEGFEDEDEGFEEEEDEDEDQDEDEDVEEEQEEEEKGDTDEEVETELPRKYSGLPVSRFRRLPPLIVKLETRFDAIIDLLEQLTTLSITAVTLKRETVRKLREQGWSRDRLIRRK